MKTLVTKVISEALRHSSLIFTMDVYSHIIKGMQEDAMTLLNEVLLVRENRVSQNNNANLALIISKVGAFS